MLRMPHRSVTRFFIPLIDVLILLFCIFLLLEFNNELKSSEQGMDAEVQSAEAKSIAETLARTDKELQKYNTLKDQLDKVDELMKRIKQLEETNLRDVTDRMSFREINIDRADGKISFYDTSADEPIIKIKNRTDAATLIERHKKEAKGRTVYYYFLMPVPRAGFPTGPQLADYASWFETKGVATNLPKGKKK